MKKILLVVVMLLSYSLTFANDYTALNAKDANVDITGTVIAPLAVTAPTAPTLPVVIKGTARTFATSVPMQFNITGEGTYGITVTTAGPATVTGVSLVGSWQATAPTALVDGAATMTYTITGLNAEAATTVGARTFNLKVTAEYTSL